MAKALILSKDGQQVTAAVDDIDIDPTEHESVLVAVDYSSLNYKDGLVVRGLGNLVRDYPHIPGIDLAGTVVEAGSSGASVGEKVVVTGWRMGELYWGGYSSVARVRPEWLTALPSGLSTRDAMAAGTAGFTAMLGVMALEEGGVTPGSGPVLVTGATGGVGSYSVSLLAGLGYDVVAMTGKAEAADYLRNLGAAGIVPRSDYSSPPDKPLARERWAGCIDSVGGDVLARVLTEMNYGSTVASVGLAASNKLSTTVLPFILRGVRLAGIDSVMCPAARRELAWSRLAALAGRLADIAIRDIPLAAVPAEADEILRGNVKGRLVVSPNS